MKRILIMGGGINQLPLIKAAKECGYYTVLCDGESNPIGREYADSFFNVDISKPSIVEKIAKQESVNGVVANTESLMTCLATVQTNCGFVSNPVSAIECLQNKTDFRKMQRRLALVAPTSICTDDWECAMKSIESMRFPLIMKPNQTSGSRGTRKITKKSNVKQSDFQFCSKLSRNGLVTIEEFVERPSDYILQGEIFVWNGVVELFIFFKTQMSAVNPYVSGHHSFPYVIDEDKFDILKKTIQKIVTETQINYGEYNVESYFTTDGEYFVIEINARQGGEEIPRSIKHSMDIDLYKLLVTTSVGDKQYLVDLKQKYGKNQVYGKYILDCKLCTSESGLYQGYQCGDLGNKLIDVVEYAIPSETYVEKNVETNQSVLGFAIFRLDSYKELYAYKNLVWDNVKVILK